MEKRGGPTGLRLAGLLGEAAKGSCVHRHVFRTVRSWSIPEKRLGLLTLSTPPSIRSPTELGIPL